MSDGTTMTTSNQKKSSKLSKRRRRCKRRWRRLCLSDDDAPFVASRYSLYEETEELAGVGEDFVAGFECAWRIRRKWRQKIEKDREVEAEIDRLRSRSRSLPRRRRTLAPWREVEVGAGQGHLLFRRRMRRSRSKVEKGSLLVAEAEDLIVEVGICFMGIGGVFCLSVRKRKLKQRD